ncbi:hypothetical protein HDU96_001734 [Phlyctochytrium bullatum]|nr:hypothetical protein HDU96_001734 [Phlyctochytrium bullatum]
MALTELPTEILLNLILQLHPSKLPKLASTCRTFRHHVVSLPLSFTKRHLSLIIAQHHRFFGITEVDDCDLALSALCDIRFHHALMQGYQIAAMALLGVSLDLLMLVWGATWDFEDEISECGSLRAELLSKAIRDGGGMCSEQAVWEALEAAAKLRSLKPVAAIRDKFFSHTDADFADPRLHHFLFDCIDNKFSEGLDLVPPNHPAVGMWSQAYGATLLSHAARAANPSAVSLLLRKGADPTAAEALHAAATCRNHTPDPYLPDPKRVYGECAESLRLLLAHGADPSQRDARGATALHHAAGSGCVAAIRVLVAAGADLEAATDVTVDDAGGTTPLLAACRRGRLEAAVALADAGAKLDAVGVDGESVMHAAVSRPGRGFECAAASEERGLLEFLLRTAPWTLDQRDRDGVTPVGKALEKGRMDLARMLLEAGADATVLCWRGRTLLHVAAGCGFAFRVKPGAEIVKMLLKAGVDLKARDVDGRTAKEVARGLAYGRGIPFLDMLEELDGTTRRRRKRH